MTRTIQLQIDPDILHDRDAIRKLVAIEAGEPVEDFAILRKSVDARSKRPRFTLQVALLPENASDQPCTFPWEPVSGSPSALIVGAGPAGLFAALTLIEKGIKPILLERGSAVESRRKDIAALLRTGEVNPESNYCFGEGGAGTYSDGKLYTRATKRGNVTEILDIFVAHGASPDIRIEAHPHIGSDKLPGIIRSMRQTILACGGEIHFNSKVTDLIIRNGRITGLATTKGVFDAEAVILAAGHSARELYLLLAEKKISLIPKPIAVGFRLEHPQPLIDALFYHHSPRHPNLPPATYQFTSQVEGRGVYSFCMCPGGHVVPSATVPNTLVVNGMSNAKRNSPFANAGIVVEVRPEDIPEYQPHGILAFLAFQEDLEKRAYRLGGERGQQAPAQRMTDFVQGKVSASLPATSYLPGITPINMQELLPPAISRRLAAGFLSFEAKRKGFLTGEAMVLGLESRTSAPVTIPRDGATFMHPQVQGLYPCGEGAGFAGGIVSSAMDGRNTALAVARAFHQAP